MDGQGAQLLQQVGDLLGQLAQQETEPTIQRAIMRIMTELDPLQKMVASDDAQDMTSGLATPNGPPSPDMGGGGGSPMPGGPPDMGGGMSSEGGAGPMDMGSEGPPPKTFAGARQAAMATHAEKGHFNPHGSKGEEQQTDKAKNRKSGGKSLER